MEIVVLKQAQRELKDTPRDILQDIFGLFSDLIEGNSLGMPVSRPLPGIAKGLHELRLNGKEGAFRVFYIIRVGDAIYIIHASNKKTQSISKLTAALLKSRMRRIPNEQGSRTI